MGERNQPQTHLTQLRPRMVIRVSRDRGHFPLGCEDTEVRRRSGERAHRIEDRWQRGDDKQRSATSSSSGTRLTPAGRAGEVQAQRGAVWPGQGHAWGVGGERRAQDASGASCGLGVTLREAEALGTALGRAVTGQTFREDGRSRLHGAGLQAGSPGLEAGAGVGGRGRPWTGRKEPAELAAGSGVDNETKGSRAPRALAKRLWLRGGRKVLSRRRPLGGAAPISR